MLLLMPSARSSLFSALASAAACAWLSHGRSFILGALRERETCPVLKQPCAGRPGLGVQPDNPTLALELSEKLQQQCVHLIKAFFRRSMAHAG